MRRYWEVSYGENGIFFHKAGFGSGKEAKNRENEGHDGA
jgi:hypothetical protein